MVPPVYPTARRHARPHGGLQVDKQKVCQVTGSVESPNYCFLNLYTWNGCSLLSKTIDCIQFDKWHDWTLRLTIEMIVLSVTHSIHDEVFSVFSSHPQVPTYSWVVSCLPSHGVEDLTLQCVCLERCSESIDRIELLHQILMNPMLYRHTSGRLFFIRMV